MPKPFLLTPEKPQEPASLVVLGFADENGAFALRDLLTTLPVENEAKLRRWIANETSPPQPSLTESAARNLSPKP